MTKNGLIVAIWAVSYHKSRQFSFTNDRNMKSHISSVFATKQKCPKEILILFRVVCLNCTATVYPSFFRSQYSNSNRLIFKVVTWSRRSSEMLPSEMKITICNRYLIAMQLHCILKNITEIQYVSSFLRWLGWGREAVSWISLILCIFFSR